jgi:hypothetical protein
LQVRELRREQQDLMAPQSLRALELLLGTAHSWLRSSSRLVAVILYRQMFHLVSALPQVSVQQLL